MVGETNHQIVVGGEGSTITLTFRVPKQRSMSDSNQSDKNSKLPQKAELWMFPRISNEPNARWYEVDLGFLFNLFNKEWEVDERIRWRSSDECIMVDLTPSIQRIDKRLQRRRKINETLANVTVTVHHITELTGNNIPNEQDWQKICRSELQNRSSNTSFLAVQYFSDSPEGSTENRKKRTATNEALTNTIKRDSVNVHRRQIAELPSMKLPSMERGCTNYTHMVRLQEVFGDWVVAPTEEVDVGLCYGFCRMDLNIAAFTPRGILKNRLKNVGDKDSTVPSDHFEVKCAPLAFEPVIFLIHMEETDSYILMDYPIKVKSCGCQ